MFAEKNLAAKNCNFLRLPKGNGRNENEGVVPRRLLTACTAVALETTTLTTRLLATVTTTLWAIVAARRTIFFANFEDYRIFADCP